MKKNVSPKKFFFIIFSNFSNVQKLLIFWQKNLIVTAEKKLLGYITVWYAFYSKFATSTDFEKTQGFSRKADLFFNKNPKFWKLWEILLFQLLSAANLLPFDEKIISRSVKHVNNRCWLVYESSIGEDRIRKRTYFRGRFCFHIFNIAKNNVSLWD